MDSFLLLPLMTHHLVPADYGRLELLGTIADIGTMLWGFGLPMPSLAVGHRARCKVASAGRGERPRRGASLVSVTTLMLGLMLTMLAGKRLEPLLPRLPLALTVSSIALDALIQVPLAWLRLH